MIEILFRGKTKLNNSWIYGMPTYDFEYIFNNESVDSVDNFEIIPETVGQFIGLTDKNGVKIFEGDIVLQQSHNGKKKYQVKFEFGCFYAGFHNGSSTTKSPKLIQKYCEVIGNIHDNPELLK
jgi:uncharacterized phage protein (TIGR01671 family)